jgi:nucleoside-diphosphate-sugar epimerase
MRVAVTGATGFIGQALVRRLGGTNYTVRAIARRQPINMSAGDEFYLSPDLRVPGQWRRAFAGADVVIHCAGQAAGRDTEELNRVNVQATREMALAAAMAGVRRFVFLSSVKAMAEMSESPLRPDSPARPLRPYGVSKLRAEEALANISIETGIEVVVVRPPVVYGPGVGGQLQTLMTAIWNELPLPVGKARARRSMIFIDNFVDVLAASCAFETTIDQPLLPCDETDISVYELVRTLATYLERKPLILNIPHLVVAAVGRLSGKSHIVQSLFEPLQIDNRMTCALIKWKPRVPIGSALRLTAEAYVSKHSIGR